VGRARQIFGQKFASFFDSYVFNLFQAENQVLRLFCTEKNFGISSRIERFEWPSKIPMISKLFRQTQFKKKNR